MGENAGFDKEREVVESLNKKLFKDICPTYQKLIKDKIPTVNPDEGVLCEKKEGRGVEKKTDLIITVRNQKINLSVKCGSGNSVHQENIDEFIKYLDNVRPLNQAEKNSIYDFHWCDGTYDNKGSVLDRKKRLSYRKSNENDYKIYMGILNGYKKAIFDRALLGTKNIPDYLIHFKDKNAKIPIIFNYIDLFKEHMKHSSNNHIGLFTIQNTWPCLGGQDKGEKPKKHRNDMQLKIKNLKDLANE